MKKGFVLCFLLIFVGILISCGGSPAPPSKNENSLTGAHETILTSEEKSDIVAVPATDNPIEQLPEETVPENIADINDLHGGWTDGWH